MTDLYTILGVDSKANTSDIASAYRNLAKIYHPDKPTGNQDKFKEISQAYNILTDERKRQIYDLQGLDGVQSHDRVRNRDGVFEQTFKVPHNNEMFNNLFEQFFGNKSNDIEVVPPITHILVIDLKDVYCGSVKQLKYHHNLICQICYGKGVKPYCQQTICPNCHQTPIQTCNVCHGSGYVNEKCNVCLGQKVIDAENIVEVNIIPGMNDKFKIKYENLGHEEPNKTTGDLIIQLSVQNHSKFEVNGSQLKLTQHISLIEAINGVSKEIIFVDGNKIRLTTQPGQIVQTQEPIIYKGSGLPIYNKNQMYGDLYVYYNIVLPEKLTYDVKRQITDLIAPYY